MRRRKRRLPTTSGRASSVLASDDGDAEVAQDILEQAFIVVLVLATRVRPRLVSADFMRLYGELL